MISKDYSPHSQDASPSGSEIRPEELSELVERLHRRNEGMTVHDVAETLGVPPESVASALRAMRSERTPPVVTLPRTRRPRKFRKFAIGFGIFLLGGTIFSIGHDVGRKEGYQRGYQMDSTTSRRVSSEDLATQLREALPSGLSLTVGEVTYTGAPGVVFANEDELVPIIEALIEREGGRLPMADGGATKISDEELRRVTTGDVGTSAPVSWPSIAVQGHGQKFAGKWPRPTQNARNGFEFETALKEGRHHAAVVAANRISEWARSPTP